MSPYIPPSDRPFAIVEAFFTKEQEKYAVPVTTKWLDNIQTVLDTKGKTQLQCTLYWPCDESVTINWILKHKQSDPADTKQWLSEKKVIV